MYHPLLIEAKWPLKALLDGENSTLAAKTVLKERKRASTLFENTRMVFQYVHSFDPPFGSDILYEVHLLHTIAGLPCKPSLLQTHFQVGSQRSKVTLRTQSSSPAEVWEVLWLKERRTCRLVFISSL